MGQKIATVLFVAIQCTFVICAIIVVSEIKIPSFHVVGIATFMVAYYTLGSASRKIFDVWVSFCRRSSDGKRALDL